MADTTPVKDYSELSDEEFLKLPPEDFLNDSNASDTDGKTDDDQSQSNVGASSDDATTSSEGGTDEGLESP